MAERGVITANVLLARRGFSHTWPQLTADFISALAQAGDLYRQSPDEAAAIAAGELEITASVAAAQMQGSLWLTPDEMLSKDYMGSDDKPGHFVEVIESTANFLADQSSIDKIPDQQTIRNFINSSYIESAIRENN